MFNALSSAGELLLTAILAFFILFVIRHLWIKNIFLLLLTHILLFISLFIAAIGGGSVQNDAYTRLQEFIQLEKLTTIEFAKEHKERFDGMLMIDLEQFKDSKEFRDSLKKTDAIVDQAEALSVGWLFFSFLIWGSFSSILCVARGEKGIFSSKKGFRENTLKTSSSLFPQNSHFLNSY